MSILGLGKQQPPLKTKDCPECEGKGYIICPECDGKVFWPGVSGKNYPCPDCSGSGKAECFLCKGTGVFYPPGGNKKKK